MIIYRDIDTTKEETRTSSPEGNLRKNFTTTGEHEWVYLCIPSPSEEQRNKGWGYRAIIEKADEEGFIGQIPILPGCVTEGDTLEETIAYLKDAMIGWMQVAISKGLNVPEPDCQSDL